MHTEQLYPTVCFCKDLITDAGGGGIIPYMDGLDSEVPPDRVWVLRISSL